MAVYLFGIDWTTFDSCQEGKRERESEIMESKKEKKNAELVKSMESIVFFFNKKKRKTFSQSWVKPKSSATIIKT